MTNTQQAQQATSQYSKVVEDLSDRFAKATKGIRDNSAGGQLYKWQVDFSYLVHEVVSGPTYIAPKIIDHTNRFIDSIIRFRREAFVPQ
jgi:hypothetical protein